MNVRPTYWFLCRPVAVRDPRDLRESLRGGMARVRHRDHEIGLHGVLGGEEPAHLTADLVDRDPLHAGVRPGQVHELEDAQSRPRAPSEAGRVQPAVIDPDQLAGLDLADERGAHDVEGAGLGGDHEPLRKLPHRQRAETVGIAGGEDRALVRHHEAERALELGEHAHRGALEVVMGHLGGEHRRDEVGVGGGGGGAAEPGDQLAGVHEVAVVAEGEGSNTVVLEDGLGVVPGGGAGGRVAGVPDREIALEGGERGLVEHLRDQPEILVDQDVVAVGDRDAGGFLAAVLLGEETEVRQTGDVLARGPHPEQAAFVFGTLRSHLEASLPAGVTPPGNLAGTAQRSSR